MTVYLVFAGSEQPAHVAFDLGAAKALYWLILSRHGHSAERRVEALEVAPYFEESVTPEGNRRWREPGESDGFWEIEEVPESERHEVGPVTHIAAQPIEALGRYFRQRCAWCGAVLVDYDYAMVAMPEGGGSADKPRGFALGALVREEGVNPKRQVVVEAERLPDDWCGAALFPEDRR